MTKLVCFYSLPRELRDHVYRFYFALEDDYAYNFSTGKLTSARGGPIDLALRSASRTIRDETRGLALEFNTLHFSSDYDDSLQERAGRFNALLGIEEHLKTCYMIRNAARSGCFDDAICAHVERQHPQYMALIRKLQARRLVNLDSRMWKEMPSESRKFVTSTLAAIAAQPHFSNSTKHTPLWTPKNGGHDPTEVIAHECKPWELPTDEDIIAMTHLVGPENRVDASRWTDIRYRDRLKYRFSAATMAIFFLESTSLDTRLQIRKVVLHEENKAVAWPECHAQGLIPFCQHNPKLQIERRVDLWKAILPAASTCLVDYDDVSPAILHQTRCDCVRADLVTAGLHNQGCIASWIMEVTALQSHGMPSQSFRLVIDGDLTPTRSTHVFDVAQRDAVWQTAFEACISDQSIWPTPPEWNKIRENRAYIMHGFPEALRALTNGQSPVSCNFDIGQMPDTEPLIRQGRMWTLSEWEDNWKALGPADLDTDVPSRSWLDLQRENMMP